MTNMTASSQSARPRRESRGWERRRALSSYVSRRAPWRRTRREVAAGEGSTALHHGLLDHDPRELDGVLLDLSVDDEKRVRAIAYLEVRTIEVPLQQHDRPGWVDRRKSQRDQAEGRRSAHLRKYLCIERSDFVEAAD